MFKRFWPLLVILPPCTMIAGLLIAAVITYIMPLRFESFATIEVMGVPGQHKLATERERLTSAGLLDETSQALDLPMRWGVDSQTSIRLLREIITVEQIRGTDLLQIRARHTNRENARDMVRALLDAYTNDRISRWEQAGEQKPSPWGEEFSGILIHDEPVIAEAPYSPNVRLNLILGFLVGLLSGLILALPIMAILHRLKPVHS